MLLLITLVTLISSLLSTSPPVDSESSAPLTNIEIQNIEPNDLVITPTATETVGPTSSPTSLPTLLPTPTSTPTPSIDPTKIPSPTFTPFVAPKSRPTTKPTTKPKIIVTPQPLSDGYTCDCSKTCPNLSCAEAQYQLNICGCSQRDGDNDGIACDASCQ